MAARNSVVCPLCSSRSSSLPLWLCHLRQVHRFDSDICMNCPVGDCNTTYKKVNSFCSHMYRQHREVACTRSSTPPNSCHTQKESSVFSDSGSVQLGDVINSPAVTEDLQHDIDQLLHTDHLEQQKSSLFLLQLKEERVISQADVVRGCKEVFEHTIGRLKAGVKHKLSLSGIDPSEVSGLDDLFSSVNGPFDGIETAYLQDKFVADNLGCIVSVFALICVIMEVPVHMYHAYRVCMVVKNYGPTFATYLKAYIVLLM